MKHVWGEIAWIIPCGWPIYIIWIYGGRSFCGTHLWQRVFLKLGGKASLGGIDR
jgi:hypothetical protein